MQQHYIIMSSSYACGSRIAIDITDKDKLNPEYITKIIKQIKTECGQDVSLSSHCILSESSSWSSVANADSFFENVKVISNIGDFISEIKKGRVLKGSDIAKYILSKISCTHLKIEKLVYLCFADYICKTKKPLFDDKIYAFKYGPIVKSVYDNYKKYGGEKIKESYDPNNAERILEEIDLSEENAEKIKSHPESESPWRSRILFAEDGVEKLLSINSTLEKYKGHTAGQLVQITHCPGSPWSNSYKQENYSVILNEDVLKYHCNEGID